jgi:hypothetical protein
MQGNGEVEEEDKEEAKFNLNAASKNYIEKKFK